MHIFISYAKVDARDIAKQIFTRLNTIDGVSAWMDTSLVPAESWAQQIQEELNRSDLVLVIITPDVNRPKSERQSTSFVLKEINYAQSLHKPVLPVMGNYTHLPVQIADLEYIDFSRSVEDGMNRLVEYILNITGVDAPPRGSTSPAPALEPWQVDTIQSGTRPPRPQVYTPPPRRAAPPKPKRRGSPMMGLFTGVMGGCVMGGIMLVVVGWALFTFVLNNDDTLTDADTTATAEAELTASATGSVTATATRTPTRTSVPLATNTQRPFVPSRTPTNPPIFVPTNTIVFPTPTFLPTNTWVVPTNTIVFPTPTPFIPTNTWVPSPTAPSG